MKDIVLDALVDTGKMLPILILIYYAIKFFTRILTRQGNGNYTPAIKMSMSMAQMDV
jgi:hypothetical protein